ncbi:MAG: hypothetical protein QW290_08200 [Sulfolobales archaeon]
MIREHLALFLRLDDPTERPADNLLFGNDCYMLYKMFSHEESWYVSMGALGYLSGKY